ncbi:hypothetical protein ACQR0Z_11475 [Bradyrhizobium sp. HKCCYLS3077]|uniref:DUF7919 family protein n=1 Tax=Bradyrhizobium sp. HKCCYLS3077 TaxID=3420761 RepID=UPI003EBAA7AF
MTSIKDLEPCRYFPVACDALVTVGWLGTDTAFDTGAVSGPFVNRLKELCSEPWQPFASAGVHACELCQFDGPTRSANVFVPHRGRIYVAPVLIVHYVAAHWYRPPDVFIDAVLACPPIRSMAYKTALLDNGGRNLVSPPKAP